MHGTNELAFYKILIIYFVLIMKDRLKYSYKYVKFLSYHFFPIKIKLVLLWAHRWYRVTSI